jgi:hypothetical protein
VLRRIIENSGTNHFLGGTTSSEALRNLGPCVNSMNASR